MTSLGCRDKVFRLSVSLAATLRCIYAYKVQVQRGNKFNPLSRIRSTTQTPKSNRFTRPFKLASKVSLIVAQEIHYERFGLTLSTDLTASSNQTEPNQTNQPPSITMGNIISSIARGINAVLMAIVNVSAPSHQSTPCAWY